MAKIVSKEKNEASIEFNGANYRFTLEGETISKGKIPAASSTGSGVTAGVQMTMSALRLALIPAQRVYANFLTESESGQFARSTAGEDTPLSLVRGIKDIAKRAKITHVVDVHQNTFNIDLGIKEVKPFSIGIDRDVKVRNLKSLGKAIKFKQESKPEPQVPSAPTIPVANKEELRLARMEMCKALVTPLKQRIYDAGAMSFMSQNEMLMLHTQMYKTKLGEFNLGELFDISMPSDQEARAAFGGVVQEF